MIKGRLNLLFQTAFCIKVKRGREVTILFSLYVKWRVVVGLQDWCKKDKEFLYKNKKPTSLKWVFDEGY